MLVSAAEMLKKAKAGHYAVGHFNLNNMESVRAFLLAAGKIGKRFALPNSEIMIHQPLGGTQGQVTDIEIHAKRLQQIKEKLNHTLAERTGQPYEKVCADTERDFFMNAEAAKQYGLVDEIMERH